MTEVRSEPTPSYTDPIAVLRLALRGRYEIERQIGQGAYATVYLARDLKHERRVAIKVLTADSQSETGELRFIREIRLVARLQHPNILPLHDSGHVENLLYYVMPYVEGETLRVRMHRERQMAVDAACGIARETADALSYAHKQGIVHRDIKPENILLSGGHAVVADFGIARAIDVAGVKQLTVTGVAGPGTPAYMSPEQLLGDRGVDARSDIYSLGCVLYEMLAGKPPFPGRDGFVKRFTEPPPRISSLHRDAPRWLDDVIAKALAKDPGDRYATAVDLVADLCSPSGGVRAQTPARATPIKNALASPPLFDSDPLETTELAGAFPPTGADTGSSSHLNPFGISTTLGRRIRGHRVAAGIVGLGVIAVAIAVVFPTTGPLRSMFGALPPVDSTRFVVLASAGYLSGRSALAAQIADSLYDAFTQWENLPIIATTRAEQAVEDGAPRPTNESGAIDLARRLGAGKVAWVQSSGPPPSPRVRIHLYDVRTREALDEIPVPPLERDQQFYGMAVQRLLGVRNRPPAAEGCDGRTRSFPAWSACIRAHVAMAKWDLAAAERGFRESVAADSAYAPARLWLAQILAWRSPEKRTEQSDLLRRALESENLAPRDSVVARGLAALLDQRVQQACGFYAELTKRDSLDFLGWYGMGECQARDSAVVRSAASPSKWAFRSSAHSAVESYMRALRLQPGAHEIFSSTRLQSLMPVWGTITRVGTGPPPERARFAAFPTLEKGDTVGFVPYATRDFSRGLRTPAADAALRKNIALLTEFASAWAERFPRSARAQEALADALEARAELTDGAALRAIDSAVSLHRGSADGRTSEIDVIRLHARKVRVLFKRGQFAAARALADSILSASAPAGSEGELDWVAALIGKADLAAHHWQRSIAKHTLTGGRVPPMVAAPASRYFTYAALGICGEPLASSRQQLESALRTYVAGDIRDNVRSDLADRADFLAMPCTGGKSAIATRVSASNIRLAQQAFARGNTADTRRFLALAAAGRRGWRQGDLSIDAVFQEAWLRLQVGDTAAAETSLDAALHALPSFSSGTFRDLAGAAAFGRAMGLRAEIAAKHQDVGAARRWVNALSELWRSADAPLRDTPRRLLSVLAAPPREG